MVEPILKSCAGLDFHKKEINACIAHGDLDKPPQYEIKTFSTVTKQGSGHIRRVFVEVAHVVARTKGRSKLKSFFLRIKVKKGTNIAAVALARKRRKRTKMLRKKILVFQGRRSPWTI